MVHAANHPCPILRRDWGDSNNRLQVPTGSRVGSLGCVGDLIDSLLHPIHVLTILARPLNEKEGTEQQAPNHNNQHSDK